MLERDNVDELERRAWRAAVDVDDDIFFIFMFRHF